MSTVLPAINVILRVNRLVLFFVPDQAVLVDGVLTLEEVQSRSPVEMMQIGE